MSMMGDEYYRGRYRDYLETVLALLEKEAHRAGEDAAMALGELTRRTGRIRDFYLASGGDLISRFRALAGTGKVGLITTCATHALLPAYRFSDELVRLQVETGLRCFREHFGFSPTGFWLPEMAYYARLDEILRGSGIEYTFLDAHSFYRTPTLPEKGSFSPARSEAGLLVFPRDLSLSAAIWSRMQGYPGDFRYREFYYDYTYSIPDRDFDSAGIDRVPFGLKVYRITGKESPKEFYIPLLAQEAVALHADDFLLRITERGREVRQAAGESPVFTLPFDAELFGHWWYEGTDFLDRLVRGIAASDDMELCLPGEMPDVSPGFPIRPAESSWGRGGFFAAWLNPECLHIYPAIADLYGRIGALAADGRAGDAVSCALREIMLAQSSDWSFFIAWDSFREYGKARIEEHLSAARRIIERLEAGGTDDGFIAERNERYPLFRGLL